MGDEQQLNELLSVVDSPTRAPDGFKANLLDELRDAMAAPIRKVGETSAGDAIVIPFDEPEFDPRRRASRIGFVIVTAAAALVAVLIFVAQQDADDATRPTSQPTVAPEPVVQVSFDAACTDLLDATTPLAELIERYDELDSAALTTALDTWAMQVDRFDERTVDATAEAGLGNVTAPLRVRLRQAQPLPNRQTLLAIEREWRDLTGTGAPLEACRS